MKSVLWKVFKINMSERNDYLATHTIRFGESAMNAPFNAKKKLMEGKEEKENHQCTGVFITSFTPSLPLFSFHSSTRKHERGLDKRQVRGVFVYLF